MTEPQPAGNPPRNLPLPGMAAISLWMLALSIVGGIAVLTHHSPAGAGRITILVLSSLFAVAGLGLMRRRRWGWALSLAAVFLFMCFGVYGFMRSHQAEWLFTALVNLMFFLYLVRPEVLDRLE